ncbi:MAG: hypothetical protein ACKVQB_06780 [Bacteroidia bacterium]
MKNFLIILLTFLSLAGYSQKISNRKIGVFGSIYRSDLNVVSDLRGDGRTKYFPSWDPITAAGFGITASMLTIKYGIMLYHLRAEPWLLHMN